MERRMLEHQSNSECESPSWSWMGWRCLVSLWSWTSCEDYLKTGNGGASSLRTSPLVQWYAHDRQQSVKRPINSIWQKYRNLGYSDVDAELPGGWKRYDYTPKHHSGGPGYRHFPEFQIPKYLFQHKSDKKTEFWYPITIPEAAVELASLDRLPIISCRTTRCWLHATVEDRDVVGRWVTLRDTAGTWAGALRFDQGPLNNLQPCELIAISKGYTQGNGMLPDPVFEEWGWKERPRAILYEFYNVLYIEWEDGIAYRKGVGRVENNVWEAQPLETIDVTLG